MLIPLSPPPGLNTDDTTFSAPGRWVDGNNVRFWEGRPQTIGGSFLLFTIANTNGIPAAIMPFTRAGVIVMAYGLAGRSLGVPTKLYVGNSTFTVQTDVSPAGPNGTEQNWALAPWGDTLLAVPVGGATAAGGTLYEQSGAGAATAVAPAPDKITWMLVTPERQVLAFGCNEEASGTFNSRCIRGCDLEDYTIWTTSSTNNAFEHILDGAGDIVSARMVGTYVAVWTTDALFMGQFLGDPSQTYRFDRIDVNCGLIGPQAVAVVDGVAYWMSGDYRIRSWAPGTLPQVLPCSVSKKYVGHIDVGNRPYVVASTNSRFSEIRFDYSDSAATDGFPISTSQNRFIAVSLADGSWYCGNGGRTTRVDSGLLAMTLAATYTDSPTVISADFNGKFYLDDTGTLTWAGGTGALLAPYITSGEQYFDNGQRRVMVKRCIPDFLAQRGNVSLTLSIRDYPQGAATTKGPYTLATTTKKSDFRASGKLISATFAGDTTTGGGGSGSGFFRIGKPVFEVVTMGER